MKIALLVVGACGGAAPIAPVTPSTPPPARPIAVAPPVVDEDISNGDPIAFLAKEPELVSWIVPKSGQLESGGPGLTVPEGAAPVRVALIETHGNDLRVGVRLETLRFALYTDREWLLATVRHDIRVSSHDGDFVDYAQADPMEAVLRAGSSVRRLAHKDKATQVRYIGAVEIDGWVPDDVLVDRAPPHERFGRIPNGRPTLTAPPGSIIYAEPRWGSHELAVMANGYFVDSIKEIDDSWVEVGYADSDVTVHGYFGRHEPPGRTHTPHADDNPPPPTTPNQLVPAGTCLYAKSGGEAIGFVTADTSVDLEDARDGWFTLQADTPWGPIVFAAQGVTAHDLARCGRP